MSGIKFLKDEVTGSLQVTITTERLVMESVSYDPSYLKPYHAFLSNTEVMEYYGDGKGWDLARTEARYKTWVERWQTGDPFSNFAVCKRDTKELIGEIVLGHSGPGVSELAYVLDKPYWNQGFGKEAVKAVVTEYAPELVKRGYPLDGEPFSAVTADVRADHERSIKILQHAGMKKTADKNQFGHAKLVFYTALQPQASATSEPTPEA